MRRTYSPVALVVDDDPNVIVRVTRGFLEDTGLGVLNATDLKTAKRYLDAEDLKIDFLLTDLGFAMHKSANEDELHDGLDLIKYAATKRPDNPNWVLSALADDPPYRERARVLGLEIEEWFPKFPDCSVPRTWSQPWAKVERDFLLKVLKREKDFRKLATDADLDLLAPVADDAVADKILRSIRLPRLTYITYLPEPWSARKPIEALVIEDEKGMHIASAPQLGIIANAQGGNADEALENLRDLIAKEAAELFDPNKRLLGYADYVSEKLKEFVKKSQPLAA